MRRRDPCVHLCRGEHALEQRRLANPATLGYEREPRRGRLSSCSCRLMVPKFSGSRGWAIDGCSNEWGAAARACRRLDR
jgi:hypothetical protein